MPCYSRVTTKMTSLADVEEAARAFADVSRRGSVLTLTSGRTTLRFTEAGDSITTSVTTGAEQALLDRVQKTYAVRQVKQFARKYGYTNVSKDAMTGEYVLVGYTR